jgi:hypothetical protein
MVSSNGTSRDLSFELQMLSAGADEECSRVLDPVHSGLPPQFPAGRRLFLHKHGLEVGHGDRRLTILPMRIGLVGQKGKQPTELACGADQVIIAQQLGELLFEIALVLRAVPSDSGERVTF